MGFRGHILLVALLLSCVANGEDGKCDPHDVAELAPFGWAPSLGSPIPLAHDGLEWMSGWRRVEKEPSQKYGRAMNQSLATLQRRVEKALADKTADKLTFSADNPNDPANLLGALTSALVEARRAVGADTADYGRIGEAGGGMPFSEERLAEMNRKFPDKVKRLVDRERTVTIGGKDFPAVSVSFNRSINKYYFKYPEIDRAELVKAVETHLRGIFRRIQEGDRKGAYEEIVSLTYGLGNTQLFAKGSSSLADMTMRVCFRAMGVEPGIFRKGAGIDLNTWIESSSEYQRNFPSMFVGAEPTSRYPWDD